MALVRLSADGARSILAGNAALKAAALHLNLYAAAQPYDAKGKGTGLKTRHYKGEDEVGGIIGGHVHREKCDRDGNCAGSAGQI